MSVFDVIDEANNSFTPPPSLEQSLPVSTLSTIQSCHVTPLATPTVGLSKHTTPNSSFSTHDKRRNSFKRSQMRVSFIVCSTFYNNRFFVSN